MDGDSFAGVNVTLLEKRTYHLCWNVGGNIYLLGGISSGRTTEIVSSDGSSDPKYAFELQHSVRYGHIQFAL